MSAILDALPQRFIDKIEPEPNSGCWLWTGCWMRLGYGMVRWARKTRLAHRVVFEYFRGQIPADRELDHLCRVRSCVNQDHLEIVTRSENTMRGDTLPVRRRNQTHCKHGHLLSGPNMRRNALGHRCCRACDHDRYMARR